MKNICLLLSLLLSLFLLPRTIFGASVPYAGKVAINGTNFQGDAQFTFALRDANGTVHWRNGADANTSVVLNVDRGQYITLLGGNTMNAFPPSLFLENSQLFLQVRFFRAGTQEWVHLQPDQRITSVPHALSAEVANLAKAVKPGAITKNMLAADVLADLNATVVLPEQNATIQTGSITREMLAPNVLSDLNATVAPGSITRQMLSQAVLADLNRTITITRSMLPASVQADLNRTITRGDLPPSVLADLNRTVVISRDMLPASVLADLNRTITKNLLGSDVLADLNRTITRNMLPADVLADLNRTILRDMLPASVLADLNRTVTKSMLGQDVLGDLNRTITKDMLASDVTLDLPASLDSYLRPILTKPLEDATGLSGGAVTLAAEVDGRGLTYEWRRNGSVLPGADAANLALTDLNATSHDGNYTVKASNAFGFVEDNATLTVQPAPPTLALEGNATFVINEGTAFVDPGFSALDALGTDLSASVEVNATVNASTPGSYSVTYRVTDAAGKLTQVTRTVIVRDATPPVVTLRGQAIVDHRKDLAYSDAGADAHDFIDGNLTSALVVTNPIDVNATGIYEIRYVATDSAGNVGEAIRQVVVAEVPSDFAHIPAGPFVMGKDEAGQDHSPAHEVYVSAFYVGKHEVTKAKYDEVQNWGSNNGYSLVAAGVDGNATTYPARGFWNWKALPRWCNARSEKEGLRPVYYLNSLHTEVYRTGDVSLTNAMVDWTANGYRLLTEAEWEKAARGGLVGRDYPNGNSGGIAHGNVTGNNVTGTLPIGSYIPNGYGLHDMYGNAIEWLWDGYQSNWYSTPLSKGADPRGPDGFLNTRSYRSGYAGEKIHIRTNNTLGGGHGSYSYFGFRLAISGANTSALSKPYVTSEANASGLAETAFSYAIEAVNAPTSYGATGLPAGLSVNAATGDITGASTQVGTFAVTLSAGNANGGTTKSANFSFRPANPSRYVVVDLSGGASASSYPVSYHDDLPTDFESNAIRYKITHLLLRFCSPGTFQMGDDNAADVNARPAHSVTLSHGFWLGVYEVTSDHWLRVMGSHMVSYESDTKPVKDIFWNIIRGGSWPTGDRLPAPDSFVAKLRAKTNLTGFDLPTEAQWEYACRAGTTTPYSWGEKPAEEYAVFGGGSYAFVGSKKPNRWGFFDMLGNVREHVLAFNDSQPYQAGAVTDPVGPNAAKPAVRGGIKADDLANITSTRRARANYTWKTDSNTGSGFRVALWANEYGAASVVFSPVIIVPETLLEGKVGTSFSYQVEVDGNATGFSATGLPPGLDLNASSGVISGTPSQYGSFLSEVNATNAAGSNSAVLSFLFLPANPSRYAVVDLFGGASASSYPVSYHDDIPADFESNASRYKSTHLLLRYVNPGTFTMGDLNGSGASDEKPTHQVTFTKGYWMGVYEVTGDQYKAVKGSLPSQSTNSVLPAKYLSWDTIRGGSWPGGDRLPGAGTFVGKLRAKTELDGFDLPTEAQWEYACRAGTTTKWYWGNDQYEANKYSWNPNNTNEHREVGLKLPNNWGFYDMLGSVDEWTLDRSGAYLTVPETDPEGANQGNNRVLRGGGRGSSVNDLRISNREPRGSNATYINNGSSSRHFGFRILLRANEYGTAVIDFPPVVLAPKLLKGQVGAGFSHQVETEGNATGFSASGLPPGLELNATSGTIAGTPTGAGTFLAEVNATNAAGTNSGVLPFTIWPEDNATYAILDLSGGANAERHEVSFTGQLPADWNGSTFKSSKMLLKRVNPGTFSMGDLNGSGASDEKPVRQVTFTKPFYLGIYEVTGAQYKAVKGSLPSQSTNSVLPAKYLSWDTIRGGSWPGGDRLPGGNTFVGKLRAKTGFATFDLPTEAQWEYTCRAGTSTKWFWGNDSAGAGLYSWNPDNTSEHREVGLKLPNNWGFYDMLGSVDEWTLDRSGAYLTVPETDPEGANQGNNRVLRGGGRGSSVNDLRVSNREPRGSNATYINNGSSSRHFGFRLALTVE